MTDAPNDTAQSRAAAAARRVAYIQLAVGLCLLAVAFNWTFRWMATRWDQPNSYYSHGWLVPLVSAAVVFMNRHRLAALTPRPTAWGLLLLVPALALHVGGTALHVGFVSGFALVATLGGLVWTVLGRAYLRVLLFPLLFLLFMVPLPVLLVDKISFQMKLMAAQCASGVLSAFGLAVVRTGSFLHIPNGTLVVDDVCSGLKYLISLLAFGALYAYISPVGRYGKATLVAAAVPVAFLANVLRVILMGVIGYTLGTEAVERWYFHDGLGFLLFVVAFAQLFLIESFFLSRAERREGLKYKLRGESPPTAPPPRPATRTAAWAVPAGALALLVLLSAFTLYHGRLSGTVIDGAATLAFPENIGDWRGYDMPLEERVYEVLGTRDVLTREYRDPAGSQVQLLVVVAHQAKRRTHPPEQCHRGEGFIIVDSRDRAAGVSDARRLPVRELLLDYHGRRLLTWYVYKSGPSFCANYWRHQLGVALGKVVDPNKADVLIRVQTGIDGHRPEDGRRLLSGFLAQALPAIEARLP